MADINLITLIILLPFLSFIFCLFLKKNKKVAGILFSFFCFISLVFSIILYRNNINLPIQHITFHWFNLSDKPYFLSILLDKYTYQMLILVNFISMLVGLYSMEYMRMDTQIHRYYGFLGLFLFSMIGIIFSGNLFQMYFFWELVGFSSYLLIGFWYQKPEAIKASKKAFIMNRIGDLCFLIGIFLCFNYFGNTEIPNLVYSDKIAQHGTLIGLLLFGGCIAKSAQFPLHTWLPDAMEGPTPVSALIHAATMVAAGIYLIVRVFPVFTPDALLAISIIGCISMLMAGAKAIVQSDIKKVLAYSTISQLGLMVLAVGSANPNLAFNHLIAHGFFKAGLFLCAGAVIHTIHKANPAIDAQNMNQMGGLRKQIPIVFWCYTICAAALIGLPFFSGFVTKDAIITAWHHKSGILNNLIFISLLVSSLFTATYMGRQLRMIFGGNAKIKLNQNKQDAIKTTWLYIPIILLAGLSTFIVIPLFSIQTHDVNLAAILSTFAAIAGILISYFLREKLNTFGTYSSKIDTFYEIFIGKKIILVAAMIYKIDYIIFDGFTKLATHLTLILAEFVKWIDNYLIDGFVNAIAKLSNKVGKVFSSFQSGQFQWYISAMIIILMILFVLTGNLIEN